MIICSTAKLSKTIKAKRKEKGFLDKKEATSFIALRNQTLSDNEKEG